MSIFLHSLFGLFLILSEATWLHHVSLGGIIPDLVLIYVICIGCFHGSEKGSWCGLILGLIKDLLFGRLIGLFGLLYLLSGLLSGLFTVDLDRLRLMIPLALTAVFTFFSGSVQAILFQLIPGTSSLAACLDHILLPELVYTTLLSVPFYVFYYLILRLISLIYRGIRQRRAAL